MPREVDEERVRTFFGLIRPMYTELVATLVDDADVVMNEAESVYGGMVPEMAYVDQTRHPMANSLFGCNVALAIFLVLRDRGISEHEFGRALLKAMTKLPAPEQSVDEQARRDGIDKLIEAADASQIDAKPGEFVYEVYWAEGESADWGMNIKSCAICHSFSRHDAMALVPYMCATDDVMSDAGHQGLRRTGTIAVGAHQCDFVYKRDGEPQHIAELYPDKIRIVED